MPVLTGGQMTPMRSARTTPPRSASSRTRSAPWPPSSTPCPPRASTAPSTSPNSPGSSRTGREKLAGRRDSDRFPFTSQRPLGALRSVLPRDAIIVAGSGNTQEAVKQTSPVYSPRTHLTSGGFSSMGWAVPAAVGAKLARPDSPVVCVLGDGDFLNAPRRSP
ncbi:thiamine pyrophosphate-dependent enzyme [Streptomyces sp. NPDC087512]|uniref:thiamine pyrophosphate-dependent enzyme n=1 Tax=Streptomyces sp. NPDC087512 TaxID=3155059 RepID=UPI003444B512